MNRKIKNKTKRASRPVPAFDNTEEKLVKSIENENNNTNLDNLLTDSDEAKADLEETQEQYETCEAFKSEVERFIEISKYFSSPLRKTASYVCENKLVSYPNPYRIEYRRGGVTTQHIRFCNQTLEPVYVKLYKCVPVMEQFKFINLSQSRCKRIPPGLTYSLGLIYDDLNEKPCCNEMLQALKNAKKDKQEQNSAEETTLQDTNDSAVSPVTPATTVNANDPFNKNKEIGKRRNSSP